MEEKNNPEFRIDETLIPLAYHEMCMARNGKTIRSLILGWAISVVVAVAVAVGVFAWMWLQYDYVSTTEYSGVYNITDSEGNVISSDLEPGDIIDIMQGLLNGEGQKD